MTRSGRKIKRRTIEEPPGSNGEAQLVCGAAQHPAAAALAVCDEEQETQAVEGSVSGGAPKEDEKMPAAAAAVNRKTLLRPDIGTAHCSSEAAGDSRVGEKRPPPAAGSDMSAVSAVPDDVIVPAIPPSKYRAVGPTPMRAAVASIGAEPSAAVAVEAGGAARTEDDAGAYPLSSTRVG